MKRSPATKRVTAKNGLHREGRSTGGGRFAVRLPDSKAGQPAERIAYSGAHTERKVPERTKEVRARILQAALQCFGAFGFEGTSTRAVADRARVTHTRVLYHFQSKDGLWTAMMEHVLSAHTRSVRENLENSAARPARDVLATFIEQFVRLSARVPELHRIMVTVGDNDTPRLQWVIDNFLRDHFNQVRALIRRAQNDGSVRECDAARLYYHIIGAGGTPFTIATEYKILTGRDIFSEAEIHRTIAFIFEFVFLK